MIKIQNVKSTSGVAIDYYQLSPPIMEKYIKRAKKESDENSQSPQSKSNLFKLDYTKTTLDKLFEIVDEMNGTTSINEKRKIYKKYMTNNEYSYLAELIQLVYHPLYRFHVTGKNARKFEKDKNKLAKINNGSISIENYEDEDGCKCIKDSAIYKLLIDLSSSVISGDTALASLNALRTNLKGHEEHVLHVVDKDLKMRFGITQINKILVEIDPKKPHANIAKFLIPDFQVSLGNALDDKTRKFLPNTQENTKNKWFISRKLDGIRCVCIVKYTPSHNQFDVTFYSRKGLEFESLGKIKDAILDKVCNHIDKETRDIGLVFDGELCIVDKDGKEDFQSVMKELQKTNHTISNPKYLLFDCLTLEEFNNLKTTSDRILSKRHEYLRDLLNVANVDNDRLQIVEQVPYSTEVFEEMSKNIQSKQNPDGWEGLILRKDSHYQGKRSNDLLKVKKFHREEYKVHSIETGFIEIFNDKGVPENIETLTAVHIKHKSFDVKVGSGFTHSERQQFFKNPDLIVGKIISVQFFEETKDKKGNLSLRFPTYLGLYGKKRNL